MELTDCFSPSPDVVYREVEGELVLMHLVSGTYFGINSVGCRIWALLEEGLPVRELCEIISTEFGAPRDVVETDICDLIGALVKEGLIEQSQA